jgi:hypothetical protein|tara:strand:+ start:11450 stop:12085 length:636 start_codon:yes stop_codon:yes gene_type:complete
MNYKKIFIYLGLFLLLHWTLLVIDRFYYTIPFNLLWISHLSLLIAAIGFLLRNNFILSGSLISVLIVHSVWIIDFISVILTGSSLTGYTSYLINLNLYRKILTSHHIYLSPLLLWALWKQKKISKNAWVLAAFIFAISSLIIFIFLPLNGNNINCMQHLCDVVKIIFPFTIFLDNLNPIIYLITLNILIDLIVFFLLNRIIYYLFKKYFNE